MADRQQRAPRPSGERDQGDGPGPTGLLLRRRRRGLGGDVDRRLDRGRQRWLSRLVCDRMTRGTVAGRDECRSELKK